MKPDQPSLNNPLMALLQRAEEILQNGIFDEQLSDDAFIGSLVNDSNHDFYRNLSIAFLNQTHGKHRDFFVAASVLRTFLKAQNLEALQNLPKGGDAAALFYSNDKTALAKMADSKNILSQLLGNQSGSDVLDQFLKDDFPSVKFGEYLNKQSIGASIRQVLQIPANLAEVISGLTAENLGVMQYQIVQDLLAVKSTQSNQEDDLDDHIFGPMGSAFIQRRRSSSERTLPYDFREEEFIRTPPAKEPRVAEGSPLAGEETQRNRSNTH
ncbi:MAG: hypothetical protein O3B09_02330 [Proteobacteria bacterium]|nr:hypothetical protein [Pseudomonadota bacterium]